MDVCFLKLYNIACYVLFRSKGLHLNNLDQVILSWYLITTQIPFFIVTYFVTFSTVCMKTDVRHKYEAGAHIFIRIKCKNFQIEFF